MLNNIIELFMEKKYLNLFFSVVIVVSSSLAIPIFGITAAEEDNIKKPTIQVIPMFGITAAEEDNIKNVQYYCC
jgi:hypothetical protein